MTTTDPRERLLVQIKWRLSMTYRHASEAVLDNVAQAYLTQLSDDDVMLRTSIWAPIRDSALIDKVLEMRHLVPNREFRSVESVVINDNCTVQIGYMNEARIAKYNSSDDRLDAICSCGWEFDFFKTSLDEAEHSAQLHVDHPDDIDEDDGDRPMNEDWLVNTYGEYRA